MTDSSHAIAAYRRSGPFAAVAVLSEEPDPAQGAADYRQALRDAYWNERDISLVVVVALCGYGAAMSAAARADDEETGFVLRSEAKALCYDLASFTWVGWGEPDLSITTDQEAIGLEAARENLRLAQDLDKGELPMSRALWMLGAHLAAAGDYEQARARFAEAADAARAAEAGDEAALADAFGVLVDVLAGHSERDEDLDRSLDALRGFEHGEGFAEQVSTARRSLGRG